MAEIETLVEEIMAKGQVPGAAVGIVKDGELDASVTTKLSWMTLSGALAINP